MTLSLQELTDARETARNLLDLLRLKASKEADQPREEPLSACQKHLAACTRNVWVSNSQLLLQQVHYTILMFAVSSP